MDLHPQLIQLKKLLLHSKLELVNAICVVTDGCDSTAAVDDVSASLLALFEAANADLYLLRYIVEKEVDCTRDPTTLFRRNSIASKMLTAFCRRVGQELLAESVRPLIETVRSLPNISEYEIDPLRLPPGHTPDTVSEHASNLACLVKVFLDQTFSKCGSCPHEMRAIAKCVYDAVHAKFPAYTYAAMSGLVFLRFICPAIVAPDTHGLVQGAPLNSQQRRVCILVSKIVQNIANGLATSGKEDFMKCVDVLLDCYLPAMRSFFEELVDIEKVEPAPPAVSPALTAGEAQRLKALTVHLKAGIHKIGRALACGDKPPSSELSRPEKMGYLRKKGESDSSLLSWRKRWFILKWPKLYYFKTPQDAIPLGVIQVDADGECVRDVADDATTFTIDTPYRTYVLRAYSGDDKAAWLAALSGNNQLCSSTQMSFRMRTDDSDIDEFGSPPKSPSDPWRSLSHHNSTELDACGSPMLTPSRSSNFISQSFQVVPVDRRTARRSASQMGAQRKSCSMSESVLAANGGGSVSTSALDLSASQPIPADIAREGLETPAEPECATSTDGAACSGEDPESVTTRARGSHSRLFPTTHVSSCEPPDLSHTPPVVRVQIVGGPASDSRAGAGGWRRTHGPPSPTPADRRACKSPSRTPPQASPRSELHLGSARSFFSSHRSLSSEVPAALQSASADSVGTSPTLSPSESSSSVSACVAAGSASGAAPARAKTSKSFNSLPPPPSPNSASARTPPHPTDLLKKMHVLRKSDPVSPRQHLNPTVVHCGFLMRMDKNRKNVVRRWVVVRPPSLLIFRSDRDPEVIERFDLLSLFASSLPDDALTLPSFLFTLHTRTAVTGGHRARSQASRPPSCPGAAVSTASIGGGAAQHPLAVFEANSMADLALWLHALSPTWAADPAARSTSPFQKQMLPALPIPPTPAGRVPSLLADGASPPPAPAPALRSNRDLPDTLRRGKGGERSCDSPFSTNILSGPRTLSLPDKPSPSECGMSGYLHLRRTAPVCRVGQSDLLEGTSQSPRQGSAESTAMAAAAAMRAASSTSASDKAPKPNYQDSAEFEEVFCEVSFSPPALKIARPCGSVVVLPLTGAHAGHFLDMQFLLALAFYVALPAFRPAVFDSPYGTAGVDTPLAPTLTSHSPNPSNASADPTDGPAYYHLIFHTTGTASHLTHWLHTLQDAIAQTPAVPASPSPQRTASPPHSPGMPPSPATPKLVAAKRTGSGDTAGLEGGAQAAEAVAASVFDRVARAGYLMKRGRTVTSFKRRWFVLKGAYLLYFKTHRDTTPLGEVDLATAEVQPPVLAGDLHFHVATAGRTFVFQAAHTHDLQEWLDALAGAARGSGRARSLKGSGADLERAVERERGKSCNVRVPVREGYLLKEGKNIKSWKKRWFILAGSELCYYKARAGNTPLGTIHIARSTVSGDASCEGGCRIEIFTRARVWRLRAEDASDMEGWVTAIERCAGAGEEDEAGVEALSGPLCKDAEGRDVTEVAQAAAPTAQAALKAGHLLKCGVGVSTWKRRYFELRGGCLHYYKTMQDSSPVGIVALTGASIMEAGKGSKKKHCFVVGTPFRNYFLVAANQFEMASWMEALASATSPGAVDEPTTNTRTLNVFYELNSILAQLESLAR